jgi:hypothetical protein
MKTKSTCWLISLLLIQFLAGCASPTPAGVLPAVDATDTPTPENTPTPEILPAMTYMPPLPQDEAQAKIVELLRDNGGCRLPCFWGLTPGISSVQSANTLLHSLFADREDGSSTTIREGDLIVEPGVWIMPYKNIGEQDIVRFISVGFSVREDVEFYVSFPYAFDSPLYSQYFEYYTLASLLSNYGKPANVYINFEADPGSPYEYYLFLDYTEFGWVAMLTMPLRKEGEVLISCPTQSFLRLKLWSLDDMESAREFGFADGTTAKSIEEATSISLDEFYLRYKDPTYTQCLETTADIYLRDR